MDPLRLLSRSTRLRDGRQHAQYTTPSSGARVQAAQLTPVGAAVKTSKKRKRGESIPTPSDDQPRGLDFFDTAAKSNTRPAVQLKQEAVQDGENDGSEQPGDKAPLSASVMPTMSDDEARAALKQHKLKVTLLNPTSSQAKQRRIGKKSGSGSEKSEKPALYPHPLVSFRDLRTRFGISSRLAGNLDEQGYIVPTEVQMGALPILLDAPDQYLGHSDLLSADRVSVRTPNLLTVAPTGSGKTLAFMIPLLHRVQSRRHQDRVPIKAVSAIILAPTKELVGQITNEGRKLAQGTGINVTQLRKGMRLSPTQPSKSEAKDPVQHNVMAGEPTVVKADVLVSTPGRLQGILSDERNSSQDMLSSVQEFVLDEADVLLDPLFREQTLGVWQKLTNLRLSVSLWSATMGSNIEELARRTIKNWQEQVGARNAEFVQEAPFIRLVVGLKDSAVPNVEHKLIYAATEQGKLMGLRQLLHPASTPQSAAAPLLPPFLIFTQTIERAVALHSELLYDIPAEAGGIGRIAVLHADLTDTARDSVMTRFRQGEIWVLITTDLLSRGVDFRGINAVVNYDIPNSSAAYVHRIGRTGRAGRAGGVAVTLYSKEDIPYLKHVANVVAMAQKQEGSSSKEASVQPWLLDALPKLSKEKKQTLKKRGIESRTTRGKANGPNAVRSTRISSKAGFVKQAQNNRKGAILGSQRRAQAEALGDAGDDSEFAGFD
ncbi:RNA-dependent ATPase rok1 [Friedmanniomyces endolithicus]|uniref:ATP-dependent RNA helicase n=1 Tax=Friedmanniomyces endolithicus TaxID=329885 RepID=A0AAN6KIT5_9PEZI|nr:RNA-dependent ATPase rok1 [Friedmanniomyces endolithicus]KAK0801615.1 RNA-dependent ATPase rok1 [Friedmanniomyces endolithicus]KAK0807342.1 RNA-dependent ATPase rok1 [Friedmanniomyces endolithicus]KAK0845845.1 RNA-dependent ATPase rok1 [Friedmanniomyces endolithicus]KAK0864540.1 RNA-dependent ATPase rok1 [Friedmanniomyces endolithicus]